MKKQKSIAQSKRSNASGSKTRSTTARVLESKDRSKEKKSTVSNSRAKRAGVANAKHPLIHSIRPNIQDAHSINLNVRGIGESATLCIQQRCIGLWKGGVRVINFGLGQSPFPVPKPVVDALKLHAHEKDYLPVRGLQALREAVAGFHHRQDHVDADPNLVLVGPGSKELMFLLQIAFYVLDFENHREALARRGINDSVALCERLLAEPLVAVLPGSAFERPVHELTARLAYVNFDGRAALTSAEAIPPHENLPEGFLEEHCADVLTGVERIAQWLA